MNIPESLLIDGLEWEVKLADLSDDQHGECRPEDCQILIASRLCDQMREVTLWHELFHAIVASRDIPQRKFEEEDVAQIFGAAFFSILKANANVTWNNRELLDDAHDAT